MASFNVAESTIRSSRKAALRHMATFMTKMCLDEK